MLSNPSFSNASLSQRLAALFSGPAWTYLATHSDLSLVEGQIEGRKVLVVATDPANQLGTFGICECDDFQWALQRARATGVPLLLLIDSAGARLQAGLPIQGALRSLMRSVMDARFADLPMLGILGRYVFGAASMLAGGAQQRLYSVNTLLAMSGPKVLQAALPDLPGRAVIHARINGQARCNGAADLLLEDDLQAFGDAVRSWVAGQAPAAAAAPGLQEERRLLAARLMPADLPQGDAPRRDGDALLCRLDHGFSAGDALALCELLESACAQTPERPLTLVVNCPGHSVRLRDEELCLSHYLVHLGMTLRSLTRNGADIRLRIEGQISGGIYIALAAGATATELGAGALVRTLPTAALLEILGDASPDLCDEAAHLEWGVVDTLVAPAQPLEYADKLTLA